MAVDYFLMITVVQFMLKFPLNYGANYVTEDHKHYRNSSRPDEFF